MLVTLSLHILFQEGSSLASLVVGAFPEARVKTKQLFRVPRRHLEQTVPVVRHLGKR
jgi:hypothetical protein